jgi:hypothetical protein
MEVHSRPPSSLFLLLGELLSQGGKISGVAIAVGA